MVVRTILVVISIFLGYEVGSSFAHQNPAFPFFGALVGAIFSLVIISLEYTVQQTAFGISLGGALGLAVGILLAGFLMIGTGQLFNQNPIVSRFGALALLLGLPYMGLILGARMGKEARPALMAKSFGDHVSKNSTKILDTSVIIDGRISDLCQTGFIEGEFVVPQFILQELQHISDSSDALKRARGRRGLDILNSIQKMDDLTVRIVEDDFPNIKEVDAKLVELAKKISAKILTNDLNLNKVAELQGVRVLNINELCNALKSIVLPGETIRVFVIKEGKEAGQGVAYLDDGTMVVVDQAKRCIGKNVDVIVTSVLQTNAGRMIFTRLKEESESEESSYLRGY